MEGENRTRPALFTDLHRLRTIIKGFKATIVLLYWPGKQPNTIQYNTRG